MGSRLLRHLAASTHTAVVDVNNDQHVSVSVVCATSCVVPGALLRSSVQKLGGEERQSGAKRHMIHENLNLSSGRAAESTHTRSMCGLGCAFDACRTSSQACYYWPICGFRGLYHLEFCFAVYLL